MPRPIKRFTVLIAVGFVSFVRLVISAIFNTGFCLNKSKTTLDVVGFWLLPVNDTILFFG